MSELFSREWGTGAAGAAGRPPLVLLHGLLGSSRNWQAVGTELAAYGRVAGLVVVDIAPKNYRSAAHRAEFAALNKLHLPSLTSRAEAERPRQMRRPFGDFRFTGHVRACDSPGRRVPTTGSSL